MKISHTLVRSTPVLPKIILDVSNWSHTQLVLVKKEVVIFHIQ